MYGLPPQSACVVPLSLFLSHTHSHKYTHIPKSEFPRLYFHRYLQARLCFWLLSSWTEAESTVPYREFSPFLSLGHSDSREDDLALDSFCPQGGTHNGSWPDSWLPHLDRSHKASLMHSGGVFQRGRCFKIHSFSQMEPKFPSQVGLTI